MGGSSGKKIYIAVSLALFLTIALLPISGLKASDIGGSSGAKGGASVSGESFCVLISDSKRVEKIKRDEYLFGVVAAEVGGGYEPEALKAQAVASYTFALYRKAQNGGKKYDITDDPSKDQAYITRSAAREKWGKKADSCEKAIDEAVAAVAGYRLVDDAGAPILAAYHAVSAGRTESAEVAWGEKLDYLQPVESVGDLLSPDYLSVRTFTQAEFAQLMQPEVTLVGDAGGWLGELKWSQSGTVTSVTVGGKALTGERVRQLLSLHSAAFEASCSDGGFTFKVKGYGHGVGMSQYGANYMAKCGSTFLEILSHYYTGCKMVRG